jgi:FADH2 O2-dependent halogenase
MPAFATPGTPPYPADAAAVHHVFNGGWMWVLRVGKSVVSAGFTATDELAEELGLAEGAPAWDRFLNRFPSIGDQFDGAELLRPFITSRRLPYRCAGSTSGAGWALLPSAAAFIDPLFSTGMPLTLLGIHRLGKIWRECWGTDHMEARLTEYSRISAEEADWVALYIGACYRTMPRFELFAPMSMFYFAAASFSEMARRVQPDPAVKRYLAADHPEYAAGLRRCAALLNGDGATTIDGPRLTREVADAISCINIAGLCDPAKGNWYGVDWDDVLGGAAKLGYGRDELWNVIREAPWAAGALA